MESMKRKDLILQTYLFISAIQNVGLMNQAPAIDKAPAINKVPKDDTSAKGILETCI